MNFWQKLKKPIIGLAPMDGVTDAAMRFVTAKYGKSADSAGKPDVMFTEFVSADGIIHGAKRLMRDFKYDEIERPVVAQIFGGNPEAFYKVAKMIVKMGFDGVDINMGCPARKVAGRGEGAGLIKNPPLAKEIIEAVKKGVEEKIPVSVKTRIGYERAEPEWWEFLAKQDLAAVTIHGRTFKQLYQGLADWEAIGEAAKVIKSGKTIFLGNGDVNSMENAKLKIDNYGVDGVLIGRAAGGNPWVFNNSELTMDNGQLNSESNNFQFPARNATHSVAGGSIFNYQLRLKVAVEHARKFEELFPQDRFFIMRKHLSWYARGFDGAAELRGKLVLTNCADEVEAVMVEYLENAKRDGA